MDENSKSEAGWRDEHRKGKTSTQQTLFAISKQSEKAFIQLQREEVEVCVGGWKKGSDNSINISRSTRQPESWRAAGPTWTPLANITMIHNRNHFSDN